jgi:hypothetical protein
MSLLRYNNAATTTLGVPEEEARNAIEIKIKGRKK